MAYKQCEHKPRKGKCVAMMIVMISDRSPVTLRRRCCCHEGTCRLQVKATHGVENLEIAPCGVPHERNLQKVGGIGRQELECIGGGLRTDYRIWTTERGVGRKY